MDEKDIKRINELYHKQKESTLTAAEKAEQAALRKRYIESIRRNMRGSLDNVSLLNPDGSITKLSDVRKKNELRSLMKEKKAALSAADVVAAGENIYKNLSGIFDADADITTIVLMFASYQNEPDTDVIYRALKDSHPEYDVAYPLVSADKKNMDFYAVKGLSQLKAGYKGIREPDIGACAPVCVRDMIDRYGRIIILIPGLAFDKNGMRAGYGGGFYDRFALRLGNAAAFSGAKIIKTGICHDFQYIGGSRVDAEEHDLRCDYVVTDKKIIYARRTS